MNQSPQKTYTLLQNLLYFMVGLLVFEGVTRKLIPALGVVIFFLKDILCMVSLYLVAQFKLGKKSGFLFDRYKLIAVLFFPVLINTLFYDPLLLFWGAKQYLLFVVTGLIVPIAFPPEKFEEFKKFIAFVVALIIPTTLVAMLQNSLPPSHWLNMSVGGESLEGFSAAGQLRVSSTFSFTGQYSFFLNMVTAFLAFRFLIPYVSNTKFGKQMKGTLPVILGMLLLIGAFITGGRTAVLGCGAVVVLGFVFASIRSPKFLLGKGVVIFIGLALVLVLARLIKPEFFAAYDERSQGYGGMSQNEEVQGRILGSFLEWTEWFWFQDWRSVLFGNGLGVMSNGSDQISAYAAKVRAGGFWTETDFPSSLWEGGLYLAVIWYGFRISVIVSCINIWRSLRSGNLTTACSFLVAYVLIIGLIGTLGIQPPVAIWWWLAVGSIITLKNMDDYNGLRQNAGINAKI